MSKVILIAEIAERDIPSRIEIAKIIRAQSSCEIFIIEQELARILPGSFYKESIVLDKSLANNTGKKKFFKKLKQNCATILIEDQEANAMLAREQLYFQSRFTKEMAQFVDEIYIWTDEHHRKIMKYFPELHQKLFITGSANYSYIQKNISSLSTRKYILFNSNYSLITNYKNVDQYIKFRNSQFKLGNEMEKKIRQLWTDTNQKFQLFCEEIKKDLSEGKRLKIRHHPSEDPKALKALLEKNGISLIVARNPPLIEDLKFAHTIKHIACNSRLEAALLKIPSYDIEKQKFDNPKIANEYAMNDGIENIAKRIIAHQIDIDHKSSAILLTLMPLLSKIHQVILKIKNRSKMKSRWKKWDSTKELSRYIPEVKNSDLIIKL